MTLKHTQFMRLIAQQVGVYLPPEYKHYRKGHTDWYSQIYLGSDKNIHYEVSRPWNKAGRQVEIGLHLETRDRDYNLRLLAQLDHYLMQIRDELQADVLADVWDRGWTKIYELHSDQELNDDWLQYVAERLAKFVVVVQPIFERARLENDTKT
ncbi:MAG: hypothetical protein F9K27_08915 [Anaerolineae bacterium]|nr:MAG: hypothetical protein F9K27_08915 [Anaerolineae bacterium]